ncbi:MAG: SGNH/GDSL hydrolase family protein [Williamsia sp.]|nr:SGNH/GDSL hydrolase family protein [Williamsia sp.]
MNKPQSFSIMGLGDSITEGSADFFSYLFPLDSLLRQAGHEPRFVGPRSSLYHGNTLHHNGFGGKTAEYLAAHIDSVYAAFPADVVLLHAGHNHFQEEAPVPGIVQAQRSIIRSIKKINSAAIILVAGVITSGKLPKYSYIPELNTAIRKMVDSLKDPHVIFVDQSKGWKWPAYTIEDNVHPNQAGAQVIATRWYKALEPLLSSNTGITSVQADSLLPASEFSARSGLPNFFGKIKQGQPVRVAFLGGSITRAGGGYRDQLLTWLRGQYPAARFEEIMAAVSGTGSDFGACRVQQHVIDHKPDLVFVEFAVNDNRWPMLFVRETMEGIVRQIWKADAATDICFIYTFAAENLPLLAKNKFPASVSAMEKVAAYYHIPSIHMGLAAVDEIEKGTLLMTGKRDEPSAIPVFSLDGVHPLPETGHAIYTRVLAKNLLLLDSYGAPGKHPLLPVLEQRAWANAGMISLGTQAKFSGNWGRTDSVTKGKEYFPLLPEVYATASPDASLKVSFTGTRFGLADIMGPGTAAIEITIDRQPPRIINRFDAFCTYYRLNYFVLSDLPPGKHTATIRLAPGQLDKAAILKTRNAAVKDWNPYKPEVVYTGAVLY